MLRLGLGVEVSVRSLGLDVRVNAMVNCWGYG